MAIIYDPEAPYGRSDRGTPLREDGSPVNFAGDYAAYQQSRATEAQRMQDNLAWNTGEGGRLNVYNTTGADLGKRPSGVSGTSASDYYGGTGGYLGGYRSPYADQIDALLSGLMNRKDFSYDVESDPLYQQYKQQYQLQGARSMQDTLGAFAGNTGGMASSWATTAAQQASDYHMGQLAGVVPQLYNQKYGQYLNEQDSNLRNLSTLAGLDNSAYGRYQDEIDNRRREAELQYQRERDALTDSRYDAQWDYNVGRDAVADSRYDSEWAYKLSKDDKGGTAGAAPGGVPLDDVFQDAKDALNYLNPDQRVGWYNQNLSKLQAQVTPAQLLELRKMAYGGNTDAR